MPAVSKKQQRFFGIVRAIQKGEMAPTTPETAKAAADMKKSDVKDFASTKHKKLPEKVVSKESIDVSEAEKKLPYGKMNNKAASLEKDGSPKSKKRWKRIVNTMHANAILRNNERLRQNEETKYDRYDTEKKKFSKTDRRMKFGKFYGKAKEAKDRLRPGEVKKWDPEKKRYVSNKE